MLGASSAPIGASRPRQQARRLRTAPGSTVRAVASFYWKVRLPGLPYLRVSCSYLFVLDISLVIRESLLADRWLGRGFALATPNNRAQRKQQTFLFRATVGSSEGCKSKDYISRR